MGKILALLLTLLLAAFPPAVQADAASDVRTALKSAETLKLRQDAP